SWVPWSRPWPHSGWPKSHVLPRFTPADHVLMGLAGGDRPGRKSWKSILAQGCSHPTTLLRFPGLLTRPAKQRKTFRSEDSHVCYRFRAGVGTVPVRPTPSGHAPAGHLPRGRRPYPFVAGERL